MGRIDRILRAVEAVPWAIQPEKLEQIAEILVARAEQGSFPTAEEVERIEARQRSSVETRGAVAVIPVIGTISRRMGMLDAMSGGASIETFQRSFQEAMADESVGSILLDIHSPGGSVYGVEEAARMIFDARGKKRVVAVADQLMASAAYYLGAAAEELVVTPSGEVGSIGVYMVHFDWSTALEDEGVRATIIKAGENKAEGNPFEPLPEEARAHFQSLIDDFYGDFVRSVARGRGVPVGEVEQNFGQGRTFTARRAVKLGMADRVATVEEVLQDLMRGRKAGRSRAAAAVLDDNIAAAAMAGGAAGVQVEGSVESFTYPTPEIEADAVSFSRCVEAAAERIQAALLQERKRTTMGQVAAAEGHVATDETRDAPTEPAPEAREDSMSDKDTAARTEGAATATPIDSESLIRKERERARQVREIARAHQVDDAKAEKWVSDGLTTDQVRGLVLEELRARQSVAPNVRVGADREAEKPFASLGKQLQAIAHAAKSPESTDRRLLRLNQEFDRIAAATGASTTVPSDGGFVIQEDFVPGITSKMWEEGRVLSRTNRVPISENSNALVRIHLKEHSRKTGSRYGGVRVFRAAEADTVASAKPRIRKQRIELEKLMGLFYATEEILQDAMALTIEAERGFRSELTFVAENEIFRGSGAGECLGFLNSNALVTVAKEGAQAADTVLIENVAKMMGRLPPRSFPTAVWFVHSSVIPQLITLKIGDTPVFLPGGNVAGARFGTLLGLPIDPVEYCATLGDVGDIILADLAQYTTIDKRGAVWSESIHVRFIFDESTFKLTYRFNGQPDWDEAVEEFQGTDKLSPFITLAERA